MIADLMRREAEGTVGDSLMLEDGMMVIFTNVTKCS